jgi:glycosyltransferase involved in cell wall biosynthesis
MIGTGTMRSGLAETPDAGPARPQPLAGPLRILFASHTYPGGPFVVGSHHLARELTLMGHKVLHISTPLTPLHFLRRRSWGDTIGRFRLWSARAANDPEFGRYVPLGFLPWNLAGPVFSLTGRNALTLTLPGLGHVLRRSGMERVDLLVVDQPSFVGIEKAVSASLVLLRSTDLFAEYGGSHLRTAEIALARSADAVIGTSEPVLRRLQDSAGDKPSLLLENGVDYAHFAAPRPAPPEYAGLKRPIAVYAGALDERFDFPAITGLAAEMPSLMLVLIGPRASPEAARLKALPNVRFLGPRPYERLPGYLQHADLGLLPLSDHPANLGRSPMKFYEYMAAGLPVVARRTPELERRRAAFTLLYDDGRELAAKGREALALHADRAQVQVGAEPHGWAAKAGTLLAFARRVAAAKRSTSP